MALGDFSFMGHTLPPFQEQHALHNTDSSAAMFLHAIFNNAISDTQYDAMVIINGLSANRTASQNVYCMHNIT